MIILWRQILPISYGQNWRHNEELKHLTLNVYYAYIHSFAVMSVHITFDKFWKKKKEKFVSVYVHLHMCVSFSIYEVFRHTNSLRGVVGNVTHKAQLSVQSHHSQPTAAALGCEHQLTWTEHHCVYMRSWRDEGNYLFVCTSSYVSAKTGFWA